MGIRIHKCLGYTLTGSETIKTCLNYEPNEIQRILYDSTSMLLFVSYLNQLSKEERRCMFDYETYAHDKTNEQIVKGMNKFVHYDDEGGLDDVLLFQPIVAHEEWSRYDDAIDHFEQSSCESKLLFKRWSSIYPYYGFTDLSGSSLGSLIFNGVREINDAKDKGSKPLESTLNHASSGSFKTLEEWENNVFPMKPQSIVQFCKFFNIFKDEKTVYKLVPAVYTYWS